MASFHALLALLLLCTALSVLGAADCSFSTGIHSFDFSPLTLAASSGKSYTATDSFGYLYEFNVCGVANSNVSLCRGFSGDASVCQLMGGLFVSVLAYWPGSPAPTFSLIDPEDVTKGVALTAQNGDVRWPSTTPHTAIINFICDSSTVGQLSVDQTTYIYNFTFPTKYACAASWFWPPNNFDSMALEWKYEAADGSIVGNYHFWWWAKDNLERYQDNTNTNYSVISFSNYSSMQQTNVYFFSSGAQCCIEPTKAAHGTLLGDVELILPAVPLGAAPLGTVKVDGVLAQGYRFVWEQDGQPVDMFLATDDFTYPVRLYLPHNGRSVVYNEFSFSADREMYDVLSEYVTTCVTQSACVSSGARTLSSRLRGAALKGLPAGVRQLLQSKV